MSEADKCKTKLSTVQAQFTRMEDTVRTMVQFKTKYEHVRHDKAVLTRAYENRLVRLQDTVTQLHAENQSLKRQVRNLEVTGFEQVQTALLERLDALEIENCNLRQESDTQRRKYEKCLDDVANQVVRAILSQKGLREEIASLRRKLRDTECANIALSSLLVPDHNSKTVLHHLGLHRNNTSASSGANSEPSVMWLPPSSTAIAPSDNGLGDSSTVKALPLPDTTLEDEEVSGESSVLRDEGYSTMSSDMQGIQETPRSRGLEDLVETQEAGVQGESSDSTSVLSTSSTQEKRYLTHLDSDIYLSVSLFLNPRHPRHSFPPSLHTLSHSNPHPVLPYYPPSIMRSLSDSHLCLNLAPALHTSLLMSDAWTSSLCTATEEDIESWVSGDWWDADYIQHWLRLDESAGGVPQQYDRAELEDWTMRGEDEGCLSPSRSDRLLISPSTYDSWSSSSTSDNSCSIDSLANSTTLGGCPGSGVNPDLTSSTHTLGVDFTRDFYRLVKFESTKSLSSTCSTNRDGEGGSSFLAKTNTSSSEDPTSSRKRTGSSVEQGGTTNPFNQHGKLLRLEVDSISGDDATLAQHQEPPNLATRELPNIATTDLPNLASILPNLEAIEQLSRIVDPGTYQQDGAQYQLGKHSHNSGQVFSNQDSDSRDGATSKTDANRGKTRERGCENGHETLVIENQTAQQFLQAQYDKDQCDASLDEYKYRNGTSQSYADSLNKHDLLIERSSTGNSEDTGCRNHTRNCSQLAEDKAQTSQLVNANADSKEPIQVSMCRQDMVNSSQKSSKHSSKATTSKDLGVELTHTSSREPVFNWRVNNKENEEPLDSRVGNKDLVRSKLQCRSYKHIVSGGALLRNGELPYELLNSGVDAYENNPDPSRDRDFQTKAMPLQHEHMKYLTNGGLLPKSEGGIKHGDLIHAYENVKLQFTADGSLPQYESHNVDQLYGNVKWDTSSVDSNLDQLYGNVTSNVDGNVRWNDETCDKHDRRGVDNVDRMFGEMKERERDKEREREREKERV
uniref:Nck-associated protein 5 n=1 Tax=Cacopsylla melanoneura TaxID=428564 RepID=A0A8D8VKJ0_9HEMI